MRLFAPIKKMIYFLRLKIYSVLRTFLQYPPYNQKLHDYLISTDDPVRYLTIALAITSIRKNKIDGKFAEIGVYKGYTSKIIHMLAPEKELYLFDTFKGYPEEFIRKNDGRFKDTNLGLLKRTIGDLDNIIIRKGIFPETARGLENEKFAFVMIDLDLFKSTLYALEFFYPRLNAGGYIFVHDYNNPAESHRAVLRAVNKFLKDKPEKIVQIPDKWGSIIISKI